MKGKKLKVILSHVAIVVCCMLLGMLCCILDRLPSFAKWDPIKLQRDGPRYHSVHPIWDVICSLRKRLTVGMQGTRARKIGHDFQLLLFPSVRWCIEDVYEVLKCHVPATSYLAYLGIRSAASTELAFRLLSTGWLVQRLGPAFIRVQLPSISHTPALV